MIEEQKTNYKIITDIGELTKFVEWLPDLGVSETFYLCLFARSKYVRDLDDVNLPHIRSDKAQLKRFTSNKERLIDKIKQLECPVGSYKQKDTIVPQEALALYITINPRCFIKANQKSIEKLLKLSWQPYNGFHPYQEVMSEIQKAKSKTRFVSFDFDIDKELFNDMYYSIDFINVEAMTVVETRGGFHLIVEPDKVVDRFNKNWYNKMKTLLNTFSDDQNNCGDIMLPVPGVYQGGFTPKIEITKSLNIKY